MLRDDVAEEADGGAAKLALRRLGVELVVPQRLEHHAHVHEVLLARLGEDENVITVYLNEAPKHRHAGARRAGVWRAGSRSDPTSRVKRRGGAAEDGMHKAHEDRRHTVQTEGADAELVLPAGNAERRFELVLLANAKLAYKSCQDRV